MMKQFSLIEIASTCSAVSYVVVNLSRVFHAVDSAALQVAHRCTPAPHGMPTAPPILGACGTRMKLSNWIRCKL